MEKQGPSIWVVGLIILATIYLTILALVGIALLFMTSVTNLLFMLIGLSGVFVVYTVYVTLRKKQPMSLVLSLTMVGIIFVVLGSIVFVPYTTNKTYAAVSSLDYTHSLFSVPVGDRLITENGTLVQNTLAPLGSKRFLYEAYILPINSSIFQLEAFGSGQINFIMVSREIDNTEYGTVFFNETHYWSPQYDLDWMTLWWTPPTHNLYSLAFIFTNLQNETASFYFRMTQFFYVKTIDASNTNYRSVMDPSLAYVGLSMVCVAVGIATYLNKRPRTAVKINGSSA